MPEILLAVKQLCVSFQQQKVVADISFSINRGETFALVGESGSGKSITALSILRLLPPTAQVHAEAVMLQDDNLLQLTEMEYCAVRGKRIALIFQDPMSSLNPVMTIGEQIAEVIRIHFSYNEQEIRGKVLALLQQVEMPQAEQRIDNYPHQLSGGQRQRVMIAIALAGEPDLLIADEPTTALDVTIQAQILALLKSLQQRHGMTLWLISHDLALVSNVADRIAVMQQGHIVETATVDQFFAKPGHPYSRKLLAALPAIESCQSRVQVSQTTLLQVRDFRVYYPVRKGLFKRVVDYVKAVDGVNLQIQRGKTLALVGESGCGKTTLGRGLLHLCPSAAGSVEFDGVDIARLRGDELRRYRGSMQIIFQDPFAAMNPRMLVGDVIAEGMITLRPDIDAKEREQRIATLLEQIGLPLSAARCYPHEFSGGQRQRICIARALAVEPKLLICDEPTSALDVSVQAQIIQLLKDLQQQHGLSYLFITHDLAVVGELADEVAVMYQGKIVEQGEAVQVLTRPHHDYTKKLLQSVPRIKH